ncbi:hypothetical protein ACFPVT_10470 [Corynebacterium choanae]|uniref:hypothetical protein n=1 Tax=Corynebacterium choanae TaxID=1862358 RepID=UPI000F50CDD1|nr:hypothetical protein [Corynebacterium choanae]
MLVKFTLRNFRSIAAAATIDFRRPELASETTSDEELAAAMPTVGVLTGDAARGKTDLVSGLQLLSTCMCHSTEDNTLVRMLAHPHPANLQDSTEFSLVWLAGGLRYELRLVVDAQGIVKESLRVRTDTMWIPLYTRTGTNQFFHAEAGVTFQQSRTIADMASPWTLTLSAWAKIGNVERHAEAIAWITKAVVMLPPIPQDPTPEGQWELLLRSLADQPALLGDMAAVLQALYPAIMELSIPSAAVAVEDRSACTVLNAALAGKPIPHSHTHVTVSTAQVLRILPLLQLAFADGSRRRLAAQGSDIATIGQLYHLVAIISARLLGGIVIADLARTTVDVQRVVAAAHTAMCGRSRACTNGTSPAQILVAVGQSQVAEHLARTSTQPIALWRVDPGSGGTLALKRVSRSLVPAEEEGSLHPPSFLQIITEAVPDSAPTAASSTPSTTLRSAHNPPSAQPAAPQQHSSSSLGVF